MTDSMFIYNDFWDCYQALLKIHDRYHLSLNLFLLDFSLIIFSGQLFLVKWLLKELSFLEPVMNKADKQFAKTPIYQYSGHYDPTKQDSCLGFIDSAT